MEYRKLGNTGIMASEIGVGSEGLVGKDEKSALAIIGAAIENGANYFDLYNPQPEVRTNLGKAIAGRRNEVFIQGHIGTAWVDGQYTRTREPDLAKKSFEEMLTRLDTDYVDVGMIHYIDTESDFERVFGGDIIKYAQELKKTGHIHHIGISSHNPKIAKLAVETGLVEVVLFAINPAYDMQPANEDLELLWADESYEKPLCNIDAERDAFYKLCAAKEVGITVMKAFAGGDLLDEKMSPFGVALTPAQCIHYALSRPGVTSVLGGFNSAKEVEQACQYYTMNEAQRDFAPVLASVPKHSFKGKCMYCGHCAPCTVSIDIASVNKFHDLCEAQGFVPETVRDHYRLLEHHASECVECGQCETNCPFGVSIIEQMQKAAKMFGE
ncbi:MAG: aldo/keto reductase [Oscillospiraceae bacterium]